MQQYCLLWKVRLGKGHGATGRTRHFRDGVELPAPAELRIVQYREDGGFYLLYCDAEGVVMTDTYHFTIDDAKAQAEWEFRVKDSEWEPGPRGCDGVHGT